MFHGRVSLNLVLPLLLVNFMSGYRLELMYIHLHCKYQVKSHSSTWFPADFATNIAHTNHFFFCFYTTVTLNFHTYKLNSSIYVWRNLVFQIVGRSYLWTMYLRMLGRGIWLKATALLVFFLYLDKSLKKLLNNRLVDRLKKCGFFLISSMVSGLLNQLQIFWQLHLIELMAVFTN